MVEVTVLISEDALARFDAIVAACELAGLQVTQRLAALGVVVGQIDAAHIPALRSVEGVATVEVSRDIQLPPADSELQ
jgi:hypothetical protein